MTHRETSAAVSRWRRRGLTAVAGLTGVATLCAVSAGSAAAAPSSHQLAPNTRFALHQPDQAAVQQVGQLLGQRNLRGAALITGELLTPQADWFTKGTPAQVQQQVRQTVTIAGALRTVPTLVVYDVPGRDCSQYSSGGAATDADYQSFIDGFVKGLGSAKAVVVVEPDGLANLPSDCVGAYPGQDIAALTAGRIADIKYAGAQIESKDPNSSVYLDAGNSAWHNTGDIASRLVQAGVTGLQGFSLNVSNYQYTPNSDFYGTWVSDCIAYGTVVNPGDFADCPNQYWNGGPLDGYASGVAMNRYGVWSSTSPEQDLNVANLNAHWAAMLGSTVPTSQFVVDTSRNGKGPNDMSAYAVAPYNQPAGVITSLQNGNWCNPPGAGLGVKPTASTGYPLAAAYLWVKTVGESDGQCNIAGGARAWDYSAYNPWGWDATQQANNDPLWGIADPAAGAWFPQQALQLAQNAVH